MVGQSACLSPVGRAGIAPCSCHDRSTAKLESIDDLQPVQADYSRLSSSIGAFLFSAFFLLFLVLLAKTLLVLARLAGLVPPTGGWAGAGVGFLLGCLSQFRSGFG